VITSAEKTFQEAKSSVEEIEKDIVGSIDQLRGHRLVPRPIVDELGEKLRTAIHEAKQRIENSKEWHPDYLKDDPILERILALFEGRVGEPPSETERKSLLEEAENRKRTKTPPGYLNGDKEIDQPYGDFLLWLQTLEFGKASQKPVVLVTSERKEDWWEKPRHELLREAWEYLERRIWIYQTDYFLELERNPINQCHSRRR
jgi:hypothetical protein